jgi:hypothetical protein
VQASCFKEVLGTQHWPLGTGRLPFWGSRAMMAAPATGETAARPMMAVMRVDKEICMMAVPS